MTAQRFRFGVTASGTEDGGDVASWVGLARSVEDRGYATLLLPDTTHSAAPLPMLAAAAAATSTLHVGTWVLCEPLRSPGLLAWEARTLRRLCGERFELGLGAGRPGAEKDAAELGVAFGTPAERVARLGRAIEALRADDAQARILVAASGPRLLRLAGRYADTVALGWPPDTDIAGARERIDHVHAGAPSGHLPELATGLVAVGDTGAPWLERMNTSAAELAARDAVTVVSGTARQMADALERRRDALGVSYVTVPVIAADAFAPVVELLADR